MARLRGGVAVIKVGGSSEVEVGEKKDRITDALNATRAAIEEGIVTGGGTALLRCIKSVDSLEPKNFDEKMGMDIVRKALRAPATQIIENARGDASVIINEILKESKTNEAFGWDGANVGFHSLVEYLTVLG